MLKTHLVFAFLFSLLFLSYVSSKILFIFVTLGAALLVDIDSGFSTIGAKAKIVSFFLKHRGMIHSLTLCLILALIIAMFLPSISLAFFLGYFSHLFLDSFTQEGIQPFWPYSKRSSGPLRTGGRVETSLFAVLLLLDVFLAYLQIAKIF